MDAARASSLTTRRWRGAIGTALAGWVFGTAVSFSFTPVRVNLVADANPAPGTVSFPLAAASSIRPQPLVVHYRVRNTSAAVVTIESRADSALLQHTEVPAGATADVRVAWPVSRDRLPAAALHLTGPPEGWDVPVVDLSNRYGFARGLLNLDIVPATQPVSHPSAWVALLMAVLAIAFTRVQATPFSGWRRGIAGAGTSLAALILAAVALAPWVSRYGLVLSPRTFAVCALLLSLGRLTSGGRAIAAWRASHPSTHIAWTAAACGCVAAAFFASAALQTARTYSDNYSGFLHLTRARAAQAPFLQSRPELTRSLIQYDDGYDGQFMYLMAFDPLLRQFADTPERYGDVVDAPAYRYGRIGFSLLTRLLSGAQPSRFPVTMLMLIVAAHALLGAALALLAVRHGQTAGLALLYLAIPGFMVSLVFALPESLAAAAIVVGLLCLESDRRMAAGVAFAVALLVRETAIVAVAGLVLLEWTRMNRRGRATVVTIAFGPLMLWRLYVGWRLAPAFGLRAYAPNPGDLAVPFSGLNHLIQAGITGRQPAPEVLAALTYPLLLCAGLALALWLFWRRPGSLKAATAIYGAIAVSLNYDKIWSHVPSGERGTFELFLGLLLVLLLTPLSERTSRRLLGGFFAVTALYTLTLSPEAAITRAALLIIR